MQLEGEVAELRRELANFRLTEIDAAGEEADQLEQLGAEAVRKRLGRICSAKAGGSHGCCLTIFGIYIGKIWEDLGGLRVQTSTSLPFCLPHLVNI